MCDALSTRICIYPGVRFALGLRVPRQHLFVGQRVEQVFCLSSEPHFLADRVHFHDGAVSGPHFDSPVTLQFEVGWLEGD